MKLSNGNYLRPHNRYSWWFSQNNYFQYMMREVSSLFIGIFTLILIWGVYRFSQGPEAYTLWLTNLWDNLLILSVFCFIFATYHSITWFWVTPKAMPIAIGGKPLPDYVIIGAHVVAWLVVTVIGWFIVKGGV